MPTVLLVPIHVDALYLPHDRSVLEPTADFSRLPYPTDGPDVNADIAYLSEEVLSRPFEDRGFHLRAGIHLHWVLPEGLRKSIGHGLLFTAPVQPATVGALDRCTLPGDLEELFATHGCPLSANAAIRVVRESNRWLIHDPDFHRAYTVREAIHWEAGNTAGSSAVVQPRRLKIYSGHVKFPAAPNRWLVTRRGGVGGKKQWIVESDYLHPPGSDVKLDAITYPYTEGGHMQSFRYLGRARPLREWQEDKGPSSYLSCLTAVGYGEATFAAFYPNCHSVFGFYDADIAQEPPASWGSLTYDIVGWYANLEQDAVRSEAFVDAIDATVAKYALHETIAGADQVAGGPFDELRFETIESQYGWKVPEAKRKDFPARTLCVARVVVDCAAFDFADPSAVDEQNRTIRVAIGNTGTEAMSAYLADHLATAGGKDKWQIEDQLEALHVRRRLNDRHVDIGPKFREARHEQGFASVAAGTQWIVAPSSQALNRTDDRSRGLPASLPPDLNALLDRLNLAQADLDRADHAIESMQTQLFADWYRYMICAYPPSDAIDDFPGMDEAKRFIEDEGLAPMKTMRERARAARTRVAAAQAALEPAVAEYNSKADTPVELQSIPAPRYWRSVDPVMLIAGSAAKLTSRFDEGDSLDCHTAPVGGEVPELPLDDVLTAVDEMYRAVEPERFTSRRQPWHPYLLEWQVDIHPMRGMEGGNAVYDNAFIASRYELPSGHVDLELGQAVGPPTFADRANRYSGRAILTGYAKSQLQLQLEEYLEQQLVPLYRKSQNIAPPAEGQDDSSALFPAATAWYAKWREMATGKDDVTDSLWSAYQELITENEGAHWCITQSLAGFNDALLMRKHTMQLPVDDPLGFDDNREFARRVRDAIGSRNRTAPQPFDDFLPIRAGRLTIDRLRLVDTFGRVQDLMFEAGRGSVVVSETMAMPDSAQDGALLRPRLVQPARINFRWLRPDAATTGGDPTTASGSSIVCGWVVDNRLDQALMIYSDDGQALGSIVGKNDWRPAPGRLPAVEPERIEHPSLRLLVAHLLGSDVQQLIAEIEKNLEAIEPEHFAHHEGTAFLVGQPMAVARASLNLELRGLPVIHQGWDTFQRRIDGDTGAASTHKGFPSVQFPIRIGDHQQFNDGLVAIWGEHAHDGAPGRELERIAHSADSPAEARLSVDDATMSFTMLLDPRAVVHATSGILPVKAIDIPREQYADTLKRLETSFQIGPVITPRTGIRLPLPSEPGFAWSWIEKQHGSWTTLGTIDRPVLEPRWGELQEIVEGWARLTRVEQGKDTDDIE